MEFFLRHFAQEDFNNALIINDIHITANTKIERSVLPSKDRSHSNLKT